MKRKFGITKELWLGAGIFAVLFASGGSATQSFASQSNDEATWFAWAPLAHEGFDGKRIFTEFPKGRPSPDPTATSNLDPINVGLCNLGSKETVLAVLRSKGDGKVRLTCGNAYGGYVHIRSGHQADWQARTPAYRLWDDFMIWTVAGVLRAPDVMQVQENMKRCYSAPINFYDETRVKPVLLKTIHPTVIVSINNKRIVTAYPSNRQSCS